MAMIDSKEALGLLVEGAAVVHRLLAGGTAIDPFARQAAYQWLLKAVEREIAEERR